MKFSAGYWEMRPGHIPFYAIHPHEIETGNGTLTVYAATKRLAGRGDTLNLPLITIQFSAPMENVIRVQVVHHKGIRNPGPVFPLHQAGSPQPAVTDEAQFAALTSRKLSVRIHKGDSWRVEYLAEGRALTSSGWRSLGFVETPEGRFIHEQLNLGVGECITPQNASKPWKALLVNVREAKSITHLEETPEGILVCPASPAEETHIKITLS